MVVKRKKKITKQRGTRTCGWGLVHRGSGQKGGAGNAGGGKKAHSKAPQPGIWTKQLMGKYGFVHHNRTQDITVNLRDLEDRLPALLQQKIATEANGAISIDLGKLGCTKILGSGKVRRKWNITAKRASPEALEKIKTAGGTITLPEAKTTSKPAKAN
jgi:large subunit ribosomal protein L15